MLVPLGRGGEEVGGRRRMRVLGEVGAEDISGVVCVI